MESNLLYYFRTYANRNFLRCGAEAVSYAEFADRVRSLQPQLAQQGVAPGSRIAVIAEPSISYLTVLFALWLRGACGIPVNTRLPAAQIADLLQEQHCSLVYYGGNRPAALEHSAMPGLPLPECVPAMVDFAIGKSTMSSYAEQEATLIFTSGSTGRPKAVVHTLANHLYSAAGSNMNIRLQAGDRWLLSLPLYHVGGLAILFRALIAGAAVYMPEAGESVHAAVQRPEATHVSLVATQLYRLLQEDGCRAALRRKKAVLLGGSAIPPELIQAALAAGIPIHTSYGSSEMSSQVCATPPGSSAAELYTSGKLLPYRELKLDHNHEILVRGRTLFKGYAHGETIVDPRDAEGWFRTGDCGFLDSRACLRVQGRLDSMFISGGENIHPEEIEQALAAMPGIAQCIVVPVTDAEFGQRPLAFVRRDDGQRPAPADYTQFLAGRLARYKIPLHYYDWPDMPDTGSIKPDRKYLQELAEKNCHS